MELERRAAVELRAVSGGGAVRLVGLAAPFGVAASLPGFSEILRAGCFARTLADRGKDQLALVEHDPKAIIARRSAKSLELRETERGLEFEIRPADTTAGRDAIENVRAGNLAGASFAFRVRPDGERWTMHDGQAVRELTDLDLEEISLVSRPAYAGGTDVSVAMRSLNAIAIAYPHKMNAVRRFLETCG